jgi:hypothetical protein
MYYFAFLNILLIWARKPMLVMLTARNVWFLAAFGLAAAVLLQSDVFVFMAAASSGILLLAWFLVARQVSIGLGLVAGVSVALAVFLLAAIPFALQQIYSAKDLVLRFGVFPLASNNRWILIQDFVAASIAPSLYLLLLLWAGIALLRILGHPIKRSYAVVLTILSISGAAGGILFFLFSPAGVQVYHFWPLSNMTYFFPLSVVVLHIFEVFLQRFVPLTRHSAIRVAIPGLLVVFAIVGVWLKTISFVATTSAMRSDHFPPVKAGELRSELAILISYLKVDSIGPALLLTNDHHLLTWWTMENMGPLLLPDVFNTTLSQADVEKQVIAAAYALRWSREQFLQFVAGPRIDSAGYVTSSTNIWFLGHNLYQANRAHRVAPIDDYPPDLRDRIARASARSAWQVIVPTSEQARLAEQFDRGTPDPRLQPRYIVVLKQASFPVDHIDPGRFRLVRDGTNFLVFKAIGGGP